jgi:hypothetical protein
LRMSINEEKYPSRISRLIMVVACSKILHFILHFH